MFLKPKKVCIEKNFAPRVHSVKITQQHIDELNREIQKNVMEKEIEREKGLEIAVRCRMR